MNLRSIFISLLIFFCSIQLVFASNTDANSQNQPSMTKAQYNAALLGWLVILNKNEINVSKVVLKRNALHASVKHYAKYLLSQHTRLMKDTLKVAHKLHISPVQKANAIQLKHDGEKLVKTLESLNDNEMQKAFIDDMVKGHEGALTALKQDINNKENFTAVNTLLKVTKKHVAMHLKRAEAIQKKLGY